MQMVSRLRDAGAVTYGRGAADRPLASAIPRPGLERRLLAFTLPNYRGDPEPPG